MAQSTVQSFRVGSAHFEEQAWRSDVLVVPGGLEKMGEIPLFKVSSAKRTVNTESLTATH